MNKKADTERRKNRMNFRVTDAELEVIRNLSQRLGLSYTELFVTAIDSLRRETNSKERGINNKHG